MSFSLLQQQVYQNKLARNFNTSDVSKEIILMIEELGELCDAYLTQDQEGILDAVGDLTVYCLGLSAMFNFNADSLISRSLGRQDNLEAYLIYLARELGLLAKTYKKSNKKPVPEINQREEFSLHLGNLLGYCILAFEYLNKQPEEVLAQIIRSNRTRSHQGQI